MLGEKKPGEMYNVLSVEVIPRLYRHAFSFSPVLIQYRNDFCKKIYQFEIASPSNVVNSSGIHFPRLGF